MAQKRVHQKMVNLTIANFFAIVLQYNSKVRIVLEHYSKKNINIYIYIFYSIDSFLSLHSLLSSLFSLLYSDPNTISSLSSFSLPSLLGPVFGLLVVVCGWVVGLVFGLWVTAWVNSGCGFWHGCGLWSGSVFGSWLGRGRGLAS